MATLCLAQLDCSAPSLRDWLGGDWGLLFSNPADFQDQGMEHDRWIEILRDEFRARAVRPLACRRGAGDPDGGWVGELVCDQRLVQLESAEVAGAVVDLAAQTLAEQLVELNSRFVLIIDSQLTRRGVLKYSAGRGHISPLDLLASVDALRRRHPLTRPGRGDRNSLAAA